MATRSNRSFTTDFKPHGRIKSIYSKKDGSLHMQGVAFSSLVWRLAL